MNLAYDLPFDLPTEGAMPTTVLEAPASTGDADLDLVLASSGEAGRAAHRLLLSLNDSDRWEACVEGLLDPSRLIERSQAGRSG